MKSLIVPKIPEQSEFTSKKIISLLEEKSVSQAIDQANWPTLFAYAPTTSFQIARDNRNLYIHYKAQDNHLRAIYSEDLSPVWTDSCVEFFVQIPGSANYYNFEFNCIGTCYAAKRISRHEYSLLTATELAQIQRYPSLGRDSFPEKKGIVNWELLVSIPLSLMGIEGNNLPESIRANFYKCADGSEQPHYLSWSPIETPKPDFHRPDFFGELYFR